MMTFANDPIAHTSLWATEENFWLEGPDFYRAHLAGNAEMWFPDRPEPLKGDEILDALRNVPRWEEVAFSQQTVTVADDQVTLRYHAVARREGQDDYRAHCKSTYLRDSGGLRLIEHRQRAL